MRRKILLAGLIIVSVFAVSSSEASASTKAKPTIKSFSPASATLPVKVTITGNKLTRATKVTFNGKVAKIVSNSATKIAVDVPSGARTGYIKVTTDEGASTSASKFVVLTPLDDVTSVVSDNDQSYCGLITSGGVDCWGYGNTGQLGNGTFYTGYRQGSSSPVAVKGVGGIGTLTGVATVVGDFTVGFCALLASGGVDCWGSGQSGSLGNGVFYTAAPYGSATPVAVEGVGGTGTLTGVKSLIGGVSGYCALLTSGEVDCWGNGQNGGLGNGTAYGSAPYGSATPVAVEGVGGTGLLGGVMSLSDEGDGSYCALLTSGAVDCWGYGEYGELGNGTFYTSSPYGSPTPVAVEGVGGTGTLGNVTYVTSAGDGNYCALLASRGIDCWGSGSLGEIGDGTAYTSSPYGSAIPEAVEGVGGTGTLGGVTSIDSNRGGSYCVLLTSDGVDCWGYGQFGQLGNGTFYANSPNGSPTPVAVVGIGGTGTLGGVTSVADNGGDSYCALLTSDAVDCWGVGENGELGNGRFYTENQNVGSPSPVAAVGVGGTGTLGGVTTLSSDATGFCGILTSSAVDCWGYGGYGEIGNGSYANSDSPAEVG